jgi:hypothetical protein
MTRQNRHGCKARRAGRQTSAQPGRAGKSIEEDSSAVGAALNQPSSVCVIRSSLTCLRQVERAMNKVCEVVITTITPNGSAALPFVIPSAAEESAVSASQYQMLTGETVLFIGSAPGCPTPARTCASSTTAPYIPRPQGRPRFPTLSPGFPGNPALNFLLKIASMQVMRKKLAEPEESSVEPNYHAYHALFSHFPTRSTEPARQSNL